MATPASFRSHTQARNAERTAQSEVMGALAKAVTRLAVSVIVGIVLTTSGTSLGFPSIGIALGVTSMVTGVVLAFLGLINDEAACEDADDRRRASAHSEARQRRARADQEASQARAKEQAKQDQAHAEAIQRIRKEHAARLAEVDKLAEDFRKRQAQHLNDLRARNPI